METLKSKIADMLVGIELYNPNNISTLLQYLNEQCSENTYDLEANLAILRLYQFNTDQLDNKVITKILLKAMTALPNPDFVLCKSLIDPALFEEDADQEILAVLRLFNLLEICDFQQFWKDSREKPGLYLGITGFEDSIRQFICHTIKITYQCIKKQIVCNLLGGLDDTQLKHWVNLNKWQEIDDGYLHISNQDELIKSKNIKEKIEFESVAGVVSTYK